MPNLTNPNDPIYQQNPNWLRPGETSTQWQQRTGVNTNTQVPTSNTSVNTSAFNVPKYNGDITTSQGRTSYYDQLIKDQEAQAQQKIELQKQAQADKAQNQSRLDTILNSIKGIGQQRTQELTDMGFNPTEVYAQQKAGIAELGTLYDDYNKTVAQRDQQIADVTGRPGQSMDFMNNQIAQINRNANVLLTQKSAAINTKSAILEAQNSNWTSAQSFVDQAIKDYTAGLTADYEMVSKFYDDNSDLIKSLGTDIDNAFKASQALRLDQINQAKQDAQFEINKQLQQQGIDIQLMNSQKESTPASYKEWQLAGGQKGTGKTYAQWISSSGDKSVPWSITAANLGLVGVSQIQANDILSSPNPPSWFTQKANEIAQKSYPNSYWNSAWKEYVDPIRQKANSGNNTLDQIMGLLSQ